jgi:ParB family transcriptional regulator, chromosome partitioning protein
MACRKLGWKEITAQVRQKPSLEMTALLALIENVQRVELNPLEIARSMRILIDDFGLSQEEVAVKTGKKRSTVANYLRILQLSKDIQEAISHGKITLAHAKVLLSCSEKMRNILFQKMLKSNLSVQKATILANSEKKGAKKEKEDLYVKDLEERMSRHFGTRVELERAKRGGQIKLFYYSLDDLDRILEAFSLEK